MSTISPFGQVAGLPSDSEPLQRAVTVTRAASEPLHLTLSKLNAANERTSSLPSADGVDGASPRMSRAYSTASKASLTSLFRQSKAPGVELWKNSGSIVAEAISTRHGYDNLRDLCAGDIDYIYPDSLRHLKTLGIGTYAEVSIAEYLPLSSPDTDTDAQPEPQRVAVKALKAAMVESERNVMDFIEEVRVLSRLKHKNIINFLGVGCYDDSSCEAEWRTLFLVQEYMDCGSLKSLILKQMVTRSIRMYTYADAMRWALDIAEGILSLHCHSPMVIHRDLKCDNIMLTTGSGRINGALVPGDASNVTAKIADLGLHALVQACSYNVDSQNSAADAKTPREPSRPLAFSKEYVQMQANGASAEQSAYEMTGQTGAYCYMAPEVVMNKPYNEKVDVFSFGVIIYELFSRRLLAADYMNTMEWDESKDHAYKVAAGYRPPFPASMPESLRSLIDSCWAGPPELRPRMKEVVRKLREIQKSGELDEMDAKAGAAAQAAGGCCAVM